MILECPSCGAENHVPESNLHRRMRCGVCKESLPPTVARRSDAPSRGDIDRSAGSAVEREVMPEWEAMRRKGPGYGAVIAVSLITSVLASALTVYALDHMQLPWRAEPPAVPQTVEVPGVLHMPAASAGELLEARGLRLVVEGERADPSQPVGSVVEQSPLPDSRMPPNSEVRVTLSTGPARATVPAIVGRLLDDARRALQEAGLETGAVTESGEGPAGTVTAATPAPGTEVTAGDRVALTVAPSGVEVPDLVGKSSREARRMITAAGLTLGRTRTRYDEDRGPYVVLRQEPAAGTQAPPGQAVDLVINEGD